MVPTPGQCRILDLCPSPVHGLIYEVSNARIDVLNFWRYYRLHFLRPHPKIMIICKIVLIAQWVFVTTPNFVLSIGAAASGENKFDYPYSISQRIDPAIYAFISLMLSSIYMYCAFVMFRTYRDRRVRLVLMRLLCTNLFLMALDVGNVISEFVGGGVVQTCYAAFMYSFVSCNRQLCLVFYWYPFQQLKLEFWMLNDIDLLASDTLER
jgi:hypothetical protein